MKYIAKLFMLSPKLKTKINTQPSSIVFDKVFRQIRRLRFGVEVSTLLRDWRTKKSKT